MKFKIENYAHPPVRGTEHSAGIDLRTPHKINLWPQDIAKVDTGVSVAIPEGYVGLLTVRSSIGTKKGIIIRNTPGVIDSDYRGNIIAVLQNLSGDHQVIEEGERFCQLVVVPYLVSDIEIVLDLPETERGCGGFGSTGK